MENTCPDIPNFDKRFYIYSERSIQKRECW